MCAQKAPHPTPLTSPIALLHLHCGKPLGLPHSFQEDEHFIPLSRELLHAHVYKVLNLLELLYVIPVLSGPGTRFRVLVCMQLQDTSPGMLVTNDYKRSVRMYV
jgi:hypothetical protein